MVVAPANADGSGRWVERSSKLDLERACLQENNRRFNQARDTPFIQEPLLSLVGRFGEKAGAALILDGNFDCPPGVDKYARRLIPFLARPTAVA